MNTPAANLPQFRVGMTDISTEQMNRHVALTRELARKVQKIPPNLAPGPRGGDGMRNVKILTIQPLFFLCKDINPLDNSEVGTAFQVYPRVIVNGQIVTGYNLQALTGTRVWPIIDVGRPLAVFNEPKALWTGTINPPSRIYTWDPFYLSCPPGG